MKIELTQQEWDLIRTIRLYRQIRNSEDKEQKETIRRAAEDALLKLIPTESMRELIEKNRKKLDVKCK